MLLFDSFCRCQILFRTSEYWLECYRVAGSSGAFDIPSSLVTCAFVQTCSAPNRTVHHYFPLSFRHWYPWRDPLCMNRSILAGETSLLLSQAASLRLFRGANEEQALECAGSLDEDMLSQMTVACFDLCAASIDCHSDPPSILGYLRIQGQNMVKLQWPGENRSASPQEPPYQLYGHSQAHCACSR